MWLFKYGSHNINVYYLNQYYFFKSDEIKLLGSKIKNLHKYRTMRTILNEHEHIDVDHVLVYLNCFTDTEDIQNFILTKVYDVILNKKTY
ncbi:hypothetical protein AhnVgp014 [Adoxophyes honmai nucleopolyhedrovirus]|uniref:Uncharacterized protein n=1 Tax=Adoxophyes honmai nucleopolyhedrovirus TaxID=224399 RepID=Q80LT2_NPVAH|nr:hypothetical protein AhnVgp014 [Adoxophyes honmai nucleopolyhedrovirus]BAC67265.1 hypothetical protein [Adoxophyes honmai nucleopolyhedrovirus]